MEGIIGIVAMCAVAAALYALFVVAGWRMFKKAGEPGWKSLIPVYNLYIQYRFSWNTGMFWLLICLSVLGSLFTFGLASNDPTRTMGGMLSTNYMGDIYLTIGFLLYVACAVITVMFYSKLSEAFGHGKGLCVALILFPNIALLYIAFGKSFYIGN